MAAPDNQPAFTPVPRVQVPASAVKGEAFQVKTIISHPMETGLRKDGKGDVIPRKIINKFICRYGGTEVFSTELHEAMAANPFLEFYLRADKSGKLEFEWHEDGGAIFMLEYDLAVA